MRAWLGRTIMAGLVAALSVAAVLTVGRTQAFPGVQPDAGSATTLATEGQVAAAALTCTAADCYLAYAANNSARAAHFGSVDFFALMSRAGR